jgi:hypothetical protein
MWQMRSKGVRRGEGKKVMTKIELVERYPYLFSSSIGTTMIITSSIIARVCTKATLDGKIGS